jgi:metal-responsive CopG/Arc/MetJ family transcriptional regulator
LISLRFNLNALIIMSNQFSTVIVMSSVTSISLSAKLRNKLDEIKDEKGYSSRSEVITDAIRTYLSEYDISKFEKGNLTATITAMYQKWSTSR